MSKQSKSRNRQSYAPTLVSKGSLCFWIDKDVIEQWNEPQQEGKRGRPKIYSNIAITCALTLGQLFHLPLRATESFMKNLIKIGKLKLACPDYTTLNLRQKNLKIKLPTRKVKPDETLYIVIDATGLKTFSEGEWKVRQHGYSQRQTWRKLQIALTRLFKK